MHSRHQHCSGVAGARTIGLSIVARLSLATIVVLSFWAMSPSEALAQLPRLPGVGGVGLPGVGGGLPNVGGIGAGLIPDAGSSLPSVPDNSVNLGLRNPDGFRRHASECFACSAKRQTRCVLFQTQAASPTALSIGAPTLPETKTLL